MGIINKTSYGKSLSNIKKECFSYGLDVKEECSEDFKNLQECISLSRYNLTEEEVNLLLRFLCGTNLCEAGCPDPFFCPIDCKDCKLTKEINKLKNKLVSLGGKLNEINKLAKNTISKENL